MDASKIDNSEGKLHTMDRKDIKYNKTIYLLITCYEKNDRTSIYIYIKIYVCKHVLCICK